MTLAAGRAGVSGLVRLEGEDLPDVPTDLGHWLLALAPIVLLLVLLAVLRWQAPHAGPVGMFLAVLVAVSFFETPWDAIAVGTGKGVWDAIFILFVVWPALWLFRVTDRAGAQEALRRGLFQFSRNELFLVMGLAWVFASFLQGITGFGTPIAVVAPLLVALGVKPVLAVVLPLIGHAWANLFGTLAVAWLATNQVVDLAEPDRTAFFTAILLWIPNLTGGIVIAWLFGRRAAVRHALPLILAVSVVHGGGQLLLSTWDPVLAGFLATTAAVLVLYPFSHWPRYSEPTDRIDDRQAMTDERHTEAELEPEPVMGLGMAFLPYAVLVAVAIVVLVVPPVESTLERFEVGPPFPEVETGYGVTQEAEDPYSPFAPLTHPGIFLVVAAATAAVVYRRRGYPQRWAEHADPEPVGTGLLGDAVPASVAIVAFMVLSTVMSHSGQTDTLAQGIAEIAPTGAYAFLAVWIGLVGSFMTTSNTASNVLFAPLQQTVAGAGGLSEAAVIGGQHAGGAIGNAIAPSNVVLGTGAAGIVGEEGAVLHRVLPWLVISALLTGGTAVVLEVMS